LVSISSLATELSAAAAAEYQDIAYENSGPNMEHQYSLVVYYPWHERMYDQIWKVGHI